jgi:hypothetical protein
MAISTSVLSTAILTAIRDQRAKEHLMQTPLMLRATLLVVAGLVVPWTTGWVTAANAQTCELPIAPSGGNGNGNGNGNSGNGNGNFNSGNGNGNFNSGNGNGNFDSGNGNGNFNNGDGHGNFESGNGQGNFDGNASTGQSPDPGDLACLMHQIERLSGVPMPR